METNHWCQWHMWQTPPSWWFYDTHKSPIISGLAEKFWLRDWIKNDMSLIHVKGSNHAPPICFKFIGVRGELWLSGELKWIFDELRGDQTWHSLPTFGLFLTLINTTIVALSTPLSGNLKADIEPMEHLCYCKVLCAAYPHKPSVPSPWLTINSSLPWSPGITNGLQFTVGGPACHIH